MAATIINKFGLSRHIPTDVRLQIRKNSGFGCVICGAGIIEYEHINPEFHECEEHNANNMTLLCPTCHGKKTRRFLSVETIHRAMQNPIALRNGFSYETIDISATSPDITFAGNKIQNCPIPIMIKDVPIITLKPPETKDSPFLLSAVFYDGNAQKSLEIIDNEWKAYTNNWDFEATGGKIIIKSAKNNPNLILNVSNNMDITIELLNFQLDDLLLKGDSQTLSIINTTNNSTTTLSNCFASNCPIGFRLN